MASKLLVGYCDPLSVVPGEEVRFMASSSIGDYEVDIVRLLHGDEHPDGPGFLEEQVAKPSPEALQGREQPLQLGSYVRIPDDPTLDIHPEWTFGAWIYPTSPGQGQQTIVSKGIVDGPGAGGYRLFLDELARPCFHVRTGSGLVRCELTEPVRARGWQFLAASFSASRRQAEVRHWTMGGDWKRSESPVHASSVSARGADLLFGAVVCPDQRSLRAHFNGKLERPAIVERDLASLEMQALATATDLSSLGPLACWDFSLDIRSTLVRDIVGGLHGETVNMPTRAVTGHAWGGQEPDWRHAPHEYGAIHFHDDDLEDAGWEPDVVWEVPRDLSSGLYAARLRAGDQEDHVPFFVRPHPDDRPAAVALVLPTLTYLAYADEPIAPPHETRCRSAEDDYVTEHRLVSQYSWHSDGSGVAFASRLRPLLNLRPRYRYWLTGHPHGLAADLSLVAWLQAEGFAVDIFTDEDIDAAGISILNRYRVTLTGTHPEYVTESMLRAYHAYVGAGGRLMYLGGNGFAMVTGRHPERPHVSEIRRRGGSNVGLWEAEPGEHHLASTGEEGGHWTHRQLRGRGLVGVDIVLQTFDPGSAYRITEDGKDARFAFVFEGVDVEAPLGDFGLVFDAAAGYEIDAADYARGTPTDCVVLARASDFDAEFTKPHADMVFCPKPNGGAVFSVSSISWCSSLPCNGFCNPVATVTGNVLRAFLSEGQPSWLTSA